jgi:hypothetical protein
MLIKRDNQGRIVIQVKKDYAFSPDRFDAAIHTFFKDDPTREVIIPKEQLEPLELDRIIQRSNKGQSPRALSST